MTIVVQETRIKNVKHTHRRVHGGYWAYWCLLVHMFKKLPAATSLIPWYKGLRVWIHSIVVTVLWYATIKPLGWFFTKVTRIEGRIVYYNGQVDEYDLDARVTWEFLSIPLISYAKSLSEEEVIVL